MPTIAQVLINQAMQALAAAGRSPTRPIEFRSQCGEDGLIWKAFAGKLDGFYIEVGAFNGYDFSVSYALECIGWKGLLIEAIPERYEQCVRNRPNSRVVHAALGPPGQPPTTKFKVTDDQFGGMLSSIGAGRPGSGAIHSTREIQVPFTTMDELLKGHTGEIDVASIDVEGFEVPLLQGFNLKKHGPKLIIIEDHTGDTPIARYMKTQPYVQIGTLIHDRIYTRRDVTVEIAQRLGQVIG